MVLIHLFLFIITSASASTLELSPQKVIDQFFKKNIELKNIKFKGEQESTVYEKALGIHDLRFISDISFEDSKAESMQPFANEQDKSLSFNLGLERYFVTGTKVNLSYARQSRQSVLNSLVASSATNFGSTRTLDTFNLSFKQDLWKNSFGEDRRLSVNTASLLKQSAKLIELENSEKEILAALNKFWSALVAKQTLEQSMESRRRYENLVKIVTKKKQLGYANPGELAQARAEYEDKIQNVKLVSASYLQATDELARTLQIEAPEEIHFKVPIEIPPLPQTPTMDIETLRLIVLAKNNLAVAKNNFTLAHAGTKADVTFVLKASFTGAADKIGDATSNLTSLNYPIYYAGLNYSKNLGSHGPDAEYKDKNYAYLQSQNELLIAKDKIQNNLKNFQRNVHASYLSAESALKSLDYRQQAVKELEQAYKQGRTDIHSLILAYNALLAAHTNKIKTIGDYHKALNQLAEARDELIKSSPNEVL